MKIIDDYYKDVVEKLSSMGTIKNLSQELLLLNTNDERVLFVYKIFENLNAFPIVKDVQKNDEVSVHYRNLGNQCFQQCKNHQALQFYNLSLLNAPLNSENYCLALSNRSAVFYELDKHKECLQDIDTVLTLAYPDNILEKLTRRQEMCKKAVLKQNRDSLDFPEINEIFTMKSDKDSRYVSASVKLEVALSEDMGRHVVAKEDIKVGEILVEEDPYLALSLKTQYLFSCNYCLSRDLNLIPCDFCCLCLYCSKECKKKAWAEYHSVECPLMANLVDMDFTKLELLALRVVIRAYTDHSNWDSLFKTIEEAEKNYNTEFRGHVNIDGKWVYDSRYYASIHTLATNIEKRSISDIFQKAVTAAVFLRFLEVNTKFLQTDCEEKYKKIRSTVAGLLLLHLMTSPTNMHGISTNTENKQGKFLDEVGLASAPYAFLSLLNHSCAPNAVRCNKLGSAKMILMALRPIKKGMQIFDNYGAHHALEDLMSRQASLRFQYKFTCFCEACINNWPTYFTLSMQPLLTLPSKLLKIKNNILSTNTIENLQKGDVKTAVKIYKTLCSLCEHLEPYAPCMELCDCQESLKQCLTIIEGVLPYGFSQLIKWNAVPSVSTGSATKKSSLTDSFSEISIIEN